MNYYYKTRWRLASLAYAASFSLVALTTGIVFLAFPPLQMIALVSFLGLWGGTSSLFVIITAVASTALMASTIGSYFLNQSIPPLFSWQGVKKAKVQREGWAYFLIGFAAFGTLAASLILGMLGILPAFSIP